MTAPAGEDWKAREQVALEAAVAARRHRRACPICSTSDALCPTGSANYAALNRGLGGLGDDFTTRGRVVRLL